MKRKIFSYCIALMACVGLIQLKAQTDVTGDYLTNAGFDVNCHFKASDAASDLPSAIGGANLHAVDNWTIVSSGDNSAASSFEYGYGGTLNVNTTYATIPATGYDAISSAGCLGISAAWSATIAYGQEVTLTGGKYALVSVAYNSGPNAADNSRVGWVPDEGSAILSTKTSFAMAEWSLDTVYFAVPDNATGKIQVGINSPNSGSPAVGRIFFDWVKLLYYGVDKTDLDAKIEEAITVYGEGNGNEAEALNTIIQAAQAVSGDASATQTEVINTVSTLNNAIWAYRYANESSPLDMTSFIVNANVVNGTGWSDTSTENGQQYTEAPDNFYLNKWSASAYTYDANQTINGLPNGKYSLTAAVRSNASTFKLYAFTVQEFSADIPATGNTGNTLGNGWQDLTVENIVVTKGKLTIGVKGSGAANDWVGADVFRLYYYGPIDLSQLEGALESLIAATEETDFDKPMNSVVAAALSAALDNAKATLVDENRIEASLTDATAQLVSAVDAAKASITAYAPLGAIIAKMENILPHYAILATEHAVFSAAVASVKTAYEDGTYESEEIADAIQSLKDAELTCLAGAEDVTDKIVNPNFDTNKDGWTSTTGASNNQTATNQTGDFTGRFWENWRGSPFTGKMYQEVSELPTGKYILRAAVFTSTQADHDWIYLYAGDSKTAITTTAPTFYSAGGLVTDGALEIGVEMTEAISGWIGADNFKLYYLGVDIPALTDALEALIATAEANASKKMQTTLVAGLNDAIEQAQAAIQAVPLVEADLNEAFNLLKAANAATFESIAAYELLKDAIDAANENKIVYAGYAGIAAFETAITAAEAVYEAASLDKDGITATIETLNTAFELIAAYELLKDAIDAANANKTDYAGYAGITVFETAIAAAEAVYEAASLDKDGITAAIETLNAAELACRLTQETPFDATIAILNPSFEAGSRKIADGSGGGTINAPDSWDVEYELGGWNDVALVTTPADNPVDGLKIFNAWAGTFTKLDLYQTVTLPAGHYTLSAAMRTEFADQISSQHIYTIIGNDTINSDVLTFSSEVVVAADWRNLEAWQTLTVSFNVPDGGSAVRIGAASAGGANSLGWFQLDNFQLTADGNFNDAINALQALLATAEALTSEIMQNSVKAELEAAIVEAGEALETLSDTALEAAIERLTAAIDAAESSADAYLALKTAIQGANARKAGYEGHAGYDAFIAEIATARAAYDSKEVDEADIAAAIEALEAAEEACKVVGIQYPDGKTVLISGEKGRIVIRSNSDQTIVIYGISGQLIESKAIASGTSFISLTPGAYIVNGSKIIVR